MHSSNAFTTQKKKDTQKTQNAAIDTKETTKLIQSQTGKMRLHPHAIPLRSGYSLMQHQIDAINQLRDLKEEREKKPHKHGLRGAVLAAVMGAGKTLMTLVYSLLTVERGPDKFPTLVISSRSLLDMWKREGVEKFLGSDVKALYLHQKYLKKSAIDSLTRADVFKFDFVFTTYDFVSRSDTVTKACDDIRVMGREGVWNESVDRLRWIEKRTRQQADRPFVVGRGVLFYTPWSLVVSDESQKFANYKTKIFQAMMGVYAEDYLCLTGTPTRNYETDIWALLRSMAYNTIKVPRSRVTLNWRLCLLDRHDLRRAIIQVTHDDCSFTMPELKQLTHHVTMNSSERRANLHYLRYALKLINKIRYNPGSIWDPQAFAQVFGAFTRLRQVAVAPFLLQEESKRKGVERPLSTFDQITEKEEQALMSTGLVSQADIDFEKEQAAVLRLSKGCLTEAGVGSSKMQMLVRVVANIPAGDKVLLFGNFTSSLDLAGLALEQVGIRSIALDGDTKDRVGTAIRFAEDDAITAMRITYPVGSTGLNLTCANHVIFLEPWFNEGVLKQATARAWRFGQDQTVYTHQLVTRNSIEPEMLKICSYKGQVAEEVLTGKARTLTKAKLNLPTIAHMVEASLKVNEGQGASVAVPNKTREKRKRSGAS